MKMRYEEKWEGLTFYTKGHPEGDWYITVPTTEDLEKAFLEGRITFKNAVKLAYEAGIKEGTFSL